MTHFDLRHQLVDQQYIAGRDMYIQQLAAPLSLTVAEYRRNRSRMLAKVRAFWITGVLERSLHGAALIALGLREQPDVVTNPWQLVVQESNQPAQSLPSGTPMMQVYDEAGGELLILGEPGAGKTTLLLQLARELLSRAEQDEILPMPVVCNLSSWAVKRHPLADWLVEELNSKYQVPRKLAQAWVGTDQILPLLDGLDEVPQEHRAACIATINTYRREHGIVPTVVCSRTNDYLAQSARLELRKAVVVQPLTSQQVDAYLVSAGRALEAIQGLLRADPGLQEMATSPLMLSILTLAYVGRSVEDLQTRGPPTTQQQVLVDYVERMLQRRTATSRYTPEQTICWLAELARQLKQQNQTEFYLERMQPDWLEEHQSLQRSYRAAVRLSVGLVSGLGAWLISGLTIGGLSPVLLLLYSELLPSMGQTVSIPLMGLLWVSFLRGVGGGIIGLLAGGIIGFLHRVERDIKPAEAIAWSWRSVWRSLVQSKSLRNGLLAGLAIWLVGLFAMGLEEDGLLFGLLAGLLGMSVSEAMSELLGETLEKQPHTMSNQRRRCPARNRVLVGLVAGLITGLFTGLVFGLFIGLSPESSVTLYGKPITGLLGKLIMGLIFGLITGLPAGLLVGLLTALTSQVETEKKSVELFTWLWVGIWRRLAKSETLRNGLVFGLLVGVLMVQEGGLGEGLPFSLIFGLSFGLLYELTRRLAAGLSSNKLEEQKLIKPNQGIHDSARNSISIGLAGGLLTELLIGSFTGLLFGQGSSDTGNLYSGLGLGLMFGVIAGVMGGTSLGLSHGGIASVQHVVLRLFLWRARCMPWNYIHFLDYAAERILLRKVGGGYIFVHRLLLEYFASLNATLPSHQASRRANRAFSLWHQKRKADLSLQDQNFIKVSSKRRIQFAMSMIVLFFVLIAITGIAGWFYLTRPDPTRVTTLQDKGYGSLRYCINNAPSGSVITFAQGLRGTSWLTGSLNVGGGKQLTLRGPGANQMTISGGNSNAHMRVYQGATLNVSGLSFKNNQSVMDAFLFNDGTLTVTNSIISDNKTIALVTSHGSGIYNSDAGTLIVSNSTFSNNSAIGGRNGQGGGIENDGTLTVSNSIFSHNSASGKQDGLGGGIINGGTLTVTQSTFSANSASGNRNGQGGGIDNEGTLTVTQSTFSANSTSGKQDGLGGGIDNAGKLTVTYSTFSNNAASGNRDGAGSGIFNSSHGTLTVTQSTFSANSASGDQNGLGGGIDNRGMLTVTQSTFSANSASSKQAGFGGGIATNNKLTVSNSTFSHNSASGKQAGFGGGIYNYQTGTLMVTNSTFSHNSASGEQAGLGGGIDNAGKLTVTYSTFSNNAASGSSSFGGGIVDYSNTGSNHLTISRSIIVANSAHDGPDILGALISDGYNLITNFAGVKGLNARTDRQVKLADLKMDPTLRNNGGPTQTLALLPGSPAIDAIPGKACSITIMDVSGHTMTITTDQRGEPRPDGSENVCDIGAYESSY